MVEVVSENFNHFREDSVPNVYLEHDVIYDRSDLLENVLHTKRPSFSLEQIVESLETKLKNRKLTEAKKDIDSMIYGYVGDVEDYQSSDVINFLDDYINGKGPVEDLFEKYLKT